TPNPKTSTLRLYPFDPIPAPSPTESTDSPCPTTLLRPVWKVEEARVAHAGATVTKVVWDGTGEYLASGDTLGRVVLWRQKDCVDEWKRISSIQLPSPPLAMGWFHPGRVCRIANASGTPCLSHHTLGPTNPLGRLGLCVLTLTGSLYCLLQSDADTFITPHTLLPIQEGEGDKDAGSGKENSMEMDEKREDTVTSEKDGKDAMKDEKEQGKSATFPWNEWTMADIHLKNDGILLFASSPCTEKSQEGGMVGVWSIWVEEEMDGDVRVRGRLSDLTRIQGPPSPSTMTSSSLESTFLPTSLQALVLSGDRLGLAGAWVTHRTLDGGSNGMVDEEGKRSGDESLSSLSSSSSSSSTASTSSSSLFLWEVKEPTDPTLLGGTLREDRVIPFAGRCITCLTVHESRIGLGFEDGGVEVRNCAEEPEGMGKKDRVETRVWPSTDPILDVTFSPNGTYLAVMLGGDELALCPLPWDGGGEERLKARLLEGMMNQVDLDDMIGLVHQTWSSSGAPSKGEGVIRQLSSTLLSPEVQGKRDTTDWRVLVSEWVDRLVVSLYRHSSKERIMYQCAHARLQLGAAKDAFDTILPRAPGLGGTTSMGSGQLLSTSMSLSSSSSSTISGGGGSTPVLLPMSSGETSGGSKIEEISGPSPPPAQVIGGGGRMGLGSVMVRPDETSELAIGEWVGWLVELGGRITRDLYATLHTRSFNGIKEGGQTRVWEPQGMAGMILDPVTRKTLYDVAERALRVVERVEKRLERRIATDGSADSLSTNQ
ncbi:hypothetical protein BJ684DRAFT_21966, partial [Piptocephalis cylindrospora]